MLIVCPWWVFFCTNSDFLKKYIAFKSYFDRWIFGCLLMGGTCGKLCTHLSPVLASNKSPNLIVCLNGGLFFTQTPDSAGVSSPATLLHTVIQGPRFLIWHMPPSLLWAHPHSRSRKCKTTWRIVEEKTSQARLGSDARHLCSPAVGGSSVACHTILDWVGGKWLAVLSKSKGDWPGEQLADSCVTSSRKKM